jgi:ParB family chromosome partitioning protein
LELHYGGRQKTMAQRLNVTESWLSRYLDLARLPAELRAAFPDPAALGIKHVTQLKPLLKPDDRRDRVLSEARRLAAEPRPGGEGGPMTVQSIVRALTLAADAPKKSGSPKKSGMPVPEVFSSASGQPLIRVQAKGKKELEVTLLLQSGATRGDAETAFAELLSRYWPG